MANHGKNPGFRSGDNWAICDVCGFQYRSSEMKTRWDGLYVCKKDWEVRHPQDFVKARKDKITTSYPVRSEPDATFVATTCTTRVAIAGQAIATCAVAGLEEGESVGGGLPEGTFSGSGL